MGENSRVVDQVRLWRDDLLNLTRRSNLLHFRHLKVGSLEITSPDPEEVRSRLALPRSPGWLFYTFASDEGDDQSITEVVICHDQSSRDEITDREFQSPDTPSDGLWTTKSNVRDLVTSLRTLHRTSTQEFLDKGIWILYLGLGMLEWEDPVDNQSAHSPLLLVPVRLDRASPREPFRLVATDGDIVINPALSLKLDSDFGITVPEFEPEASVSDIFSVFAKVAETHPSWSVLPRTILARFSFEKEVMYQDLRKNEVQIVAHPLISALATPPSKEKSVTLTFDAVPDHELDEITPPEDHPTILDADATQRQCIEAAARGATFIMDGPPGTGKSQTIANIIAELIKAGKRVLFVSEKAAALDVVHKRLEQAGLDDFLLSLHDQKMTRKDVAISLARSLTQHPHVRSTVTSTEREALRNRRRELSAYAAAMNEVRRPLELSLYDAVGRVSALHALPHAPVAEALGAVMTAADFAATKELADRLARAWGPVEQGSEFLWRDLDFVEGTAANRYRLENELRQAIVGLDDLALRSAELARDLVMPSPVSFYDARQILQVHVLLSQRIVVPTTWLTTRDLGLVEQVIGELRSLSEDYGKDRETLRQLVGEQWLAVLDLDLARAATTTGPLGQLLDAPHALDESGRSELAAIERLFRELRTLATQLLDVGLRVREGFGMVDEPLTMSRVEQLVQLGHLASATHRPLRSWFNPAITGGLEEACASLRSATEAVIATRSPLTSIFEDTVLQLDLEGLFTRFATVHKGAGRLRKSYRMDRDLLVPHLKARRLTDEALTALEAALGWQHRAQELSRTERRHADLLGNYYEEVETDFDAADEAIKVARTAFSILGADIESERAVTALLQPEIELVADIQKLEQLSLRFYSITERVPTEILDAVRRVPLVDLTKVAQESVPLCAALQSPLEQLELISKRAFTVGELRTVAELAANIDETRDAIEQRFPADRALLGDTYRGIDTDWDLLVAGIQWSQMVVRLLGGPVSVAQSDALLAASPSPEALKDAFEIWESARETLLAHFVGGHSTSLRGRLNSNFDDAQLLLAQLLRTLDDIVEWETFAVTSESLSMLGMKEQVAYCVNAGIPAVSVAGVLERSVLEGFIDTTFRSDIRLQPQRAADRNAIVSEFRRLDRQLFELASEQVIESCNERRPRTSLGQVAIIRREAEKQRRHMPIRELLRASADVAQQLKPCFLMSPLTVSQFLTPDLEFDTVIIDEASQVRPCDAINSIYRGRQLIIAGDQRQLPPTSFFTHTDADESDEYEEGQFEEFQSILDLCKGQGDFSSLPLSWHYRSRHESLITFSNYSFYNGALVTFPSAIPDGDDAGVAFYKVDGVYRRGGARDNPIEAEAVIDRILEHARWHPSLSLGVVAFSEAQATAIESALDRRRRELPELDYYFTDDRLRGFFVKNLESVQGDERDIIIFSIGYGRDEFGKFSMSFGPLNKPGGERRLNVAVTRARQRVEIVSSVSAADFVSDTTNSGVRHLRRYLDFAERGIPALGLELGTGDRDTESPFEEEVARLLRSWGYEVVPQVGQSGYRIDLGVRDPRGRSPYLLGVECDGYAYHSSKVARDRDRLRHEQLVSQGWTIHHVWGSAWYHERERAEQDLRVALDSALEGGGLGSTVSRVGAQPVAVQFQSAMPEEVRQWTVPYAFTRLNVPTKRMEITSETARPILKVAVETVVTTEGPIHQEILIRRIREAWGVGRAGSRIRETIDEILGYLLQAQKVRRDKAGFVFLSSQKVRSVRVPVEGQPETERAAEHVPLTEIALAVLQVASEARSIDQDEVTRIVARIFGWRRTTDGIYSRIGEAVDRLISNEQIERVGVQIRYRPSNHS